VRGKVEMASSESDSGEPRGAKDEFPAPVKLSSFLDERLILCGMKARTKREAIEELSSIVAEMKPELDKEATAMGRGCAFPHGKVAGLDRVIVALGRCEAGIDFDALDGKPVNLIVLFLTGKVISLEYLAALAAFASLSRDPEKLSAILSAKTAREVMKAADEFDVTFHG
jgi:PTS system nitrogen regulatory IIA component